MSAVLLAPTLTVGDAAEAFTHARLGEQLVCREPDEDGVETPGLTASDWGDDGPREKDAAVACMRCAVVAECGIYALVAREPLGVWGGMTSTERRRILRRSGVRL